MRREENSGIVVVVVVVVVVLLLISNIMDSISFTRKTRSRQQRCT
jgi:hypothetical protein